MRPPRFGGGRRTRVTPDRILSKMYPLLVMPTETDRFSAPTPDEISQCAYLIWEREGRPAGREKEHWLQAETQLLACRAHEVWTNGPQQAGHAETPQTDRQAA